MNIKKKLASIAVIGAVLASGFVAAAPASAAEISGATLTITPTSGNVNTDTVFLNSIAASVGAPVGFRALGATVVFQNGNRIGSVSSTRTTSMVAEAGTNGLDGNPASMDRSLIPTNNFVSNRLLNDPALGNLVPGGLVTGQFELRFYYFASATSPNYNDPYVKLDMTYNASTGAWAVYTAPVAAIVTTTSLTASAAASTVTLTTTVKKPDTTTATDATGDVVFKEGATTVATVPVASGVATASLTGVANGSHTYTAEFVPTGTVYAGSISGGATVQVGAITATSTINVTIPNNVGALTLTGVSSSVNLGTAVLGSGTLNASGTLTAVVTDTRQLDYPTWSLTGQVGDFTAGTKVLDGKYLGWSPSVSGSAVSGPQSSVAGAPVAPAPATTNGIKAISTLATGQPNPAGTVTNASAVLELKAPSNTPQGAYSATLTLTLI
jgi:hypothetical protein